MDYSQEILNRFRAVKWFDTEPIKGLKGWFLLEANPLPPKSDLPMVMADIWNIEPVHVDITSGKLYHSKECTSSNHDLPHWRIKRAIETIEEATYKVVVYPGKTELLNGLPIAIPIDPFITYDIYPDHPHLNQSGIYTQETYLPDSICYVENPRELGDNQLDILINAIKEVCIWLFRHQVWLETRKQKKPGIWIGPSAIQFDGHLERHCQRLNPQSPCYCNQGKKYIDCHLVRDVMSLGKCSEKKARQLVEKYVYNGIWEKNIGIPHQKSLEKLRRNFIN